nr:OBAP family protein [Pseudoxanthomonas mexicana]
MNAYLNGFHFYNGRLDEQMEAHHYCATLNEDVTQCVIFDGSTREARIMGVEYIISARLFAGLDDREKFLWHGHAYEVVSGTLAAPGLPAMAEHELMERLVGTYGKTWHTWHTDRQNELPHGMPQLMMGFIADGQADLPMIAARDARLGIDSAANRVRRVGIPLPEPIPGADAWTRGKVVQITDVVGTDHHAPSAHTR